MFQITQAVLEEMLGHAKNAMPLECCGLLAGEALLADELLPCTNENRSPTSFSIAPVELFDSFRRLRRASRRLLGIYHSHPGGPEYPSRRDADEFEYPEAGYWIISLHRPSPVVRCFRWTGSGFEEAAFQTVRSDAQTREQVQEVERGDLP